MSRPSVVFAMTGAYGIPGGIATANINILHVLSEFVVEGRVRLKVLGFLEDGGHRPAMLPPSVPFESFVGNRRAFARAMLRDAPARPLYIMDHVGLTLPILPLMLLRVIRSVIFAHGWEYWKHVRWRHALALRAATLNLANSDFTVKKMKARSPALRVRSCLLGLSPEFRINEVPPERPQERIELSACDGVTRPLGERVLLLAARMDPREREKGHDRLMTVMPQLLRRHPSIQVVFTGDGADRPRLESAARECGIAAAVFFTGHIPIDLLDQLYRHCYAYVMPSTQEGFGLVYLEAMNQAKPCVGCYDQGCEDVIVDGETGFLLRNPDDPVELQSVLHSLLEDPARAERLGRRGFERLHTTFTPVQHQARVREALTPLLPRLPTDARDSG